MTLSTPKSELTSARMFDKKSDVDLAYWIDTDAAGMDGQPGRNNHVAATRAAAERLLALHDALGFIDQTVYANEDNSHRVKWRNSEVLELLAEIRAKLTASPANVEVGRHDA